MAFPDASVLDNANRGNSGPPLSASWTTLTNGHIVISNAIRGNTASAYNWSAWNASSFNADQHMFLTVSTLPGTGNEIGLDLRLSTLVAGTADGYRMRYWQRSGVDEWAFYTITDGASSVNSQKIGPSFYQDVAAGDSIGFAAFGEFLLAFHKPSAGAWTCIGATWDNTYTAGGYIGLYNWSTTAIMDDVGGGNITSITDVREEFPYPVIRGTNTLTAAASGTTQTPTMPPHQTGDILFAYGFGNTGQNVTCSTEGWASVGAENDTNMSYGLFWKRAASSSETAPTITYGSAGSTSNGHYTWCFAVRNAIASGTPYEDYTPNTASGNTPTSSTTPASSTVTSTVDDAIAIALALVDDNNTVSSGWPPSDWHPFGATTTQTPGNTAGSDTGGDHRHFPIFKLLPSAGDATGVTVVTQSAADYWKTLAFVVKPEPLVTTVAVGVEQTLLWNNQAAIPATRTLLWNNQAAIPATRTLLWNVSGSGVGPTQILLWNNQVTANTSRTLLWNNSTPTNLTRILLWSQRTAVPAVAGISLTESFPYSDGNLVGQGDWIATPWGDATATVTSGRIASGAANGQWRGASSTATYGFGAVEFSLPVVPTAREIEVYLLETSGAPVTSIGVGVGPNWIYLARYVAASFTNLAQATPTITDGARIRLEVDATYARAYLNGVQVLQAAHGLAATSGHLGVEIGDAATRLDDLIVVEDQRANIDLLWSQRAAIPATRTLLWSVIGPVGVERTLLWNNSTFVNASRTLLWNNSTFVGVSRTALWNNSIAVGTSGPGVLVNETFPYSNGNLEGNGNWESPLVTGDDGLDVTGGQIYKSGGTTWVGSYLAETYGDGIYSLTVSVHPVGGAYFHICASPGTLDSYFLRLEYVFSGGDKTRFFFGRYDDGSATNLTSAIDVDVLADGDKIRIVKNGTNFKPYYFRQSDGFWTQIGAAEGYTDSAYSSGYVGLETNVTGGRYDDLIVESLTGGTQGHTLKWNTLEPPAGASRTLLWNNQVTANASRTLLWNNQAAVPATRTLLWNVRSAAGVTQTLLWNNQITANVSRTLLWHLLAAVSTTRILLWNNSTSVGTEWTLLWNNQVDAGATRQLVWNVEAIATAGTEWTLLWSQQVAVPTTQTLLWNNQAAVALDRTLLWNNQVTATADRTLLWASLAPVAMNRTLLWASLSPVAFDRTLLWHSYAAVGASRTALWNQIGLAGTTQTLVWNVSGDAAAATRTLRWDVSVPRGTQRILHWRVSSLAPASEFTLLWSQRSAASASRTSLWSVQSLAGALTRLIWNVRALAPAPRTLVWTSLTSADTERSLLWNNQVTATAPQRSIRWDVLSLVGVQRILHWRVSVVVPGTERTLLWHSRSSAGTTQTLLWHTLSNPAATRSLRWHVRSAPSATRTLLWHSTALATAPDHTLLWHVRLAAPAGRTLRWDVHRLATAERTLRWHVSTTVPATERTLLWSIRALAPTTQTLLWDNLRLASLTATLCWRNEVLIIVSDPFYPSTPGEDHLFGQIDGILDGSPSGASLLGGLSSGELFGAPEEV